MIDSLSEPDSLPMGRINGRKKILDFPAAITNRRKIERYRLDPERSDVWRLNLNEPQKPKTAEWLRRRVTPEANMLKKAGAYGMKYGQEIPPSFKSNPFILKSIMNIKQPVPIPVSNNSIVSQVSTKLSNCYFDVSKVTKPPALPLNGMLSIQLPVFEMDLTYLGPFENIGLFSTNGVSGSKVRFSSADKLRRSEMDTEGDLNTGSESLTECKKALSAYEFHRHLEPSCTQPSLCTLKNDRKLPRSSELIDLDQLRAQLRSQPSLSNTGNEDANSNQNLKPTMDNRISDSNKMSKTKPTENCTPKPAASNELNKKTYVKDKVDIPSSKKFGVATSQEKKTKSVDSQTNVNYHRREVTTQSTEGHDGEFEVVKYS